MNPDPDFNDLDKAVSSLVGGAKSDNTQQSTASDNKAAPSQLKPHAGRGKFMDVMHPNSDMTTIIPPTATVANNAGAPSIGKTIDPTSKDIKPDPVPEKNIDDLPVVKQLSPIDDPDPKSLIATPDIAETIKPDPLEEAAKKERERVARDGAKHRKAEHKSDEKKPEDEPKQADQSSKDEAKTEDKPSDDKIDNKPLFLEDAKVEKRPLGAFNEEAPNDNERPALKTKKNKTKDDAQKAANSPPPPEFDKEVVALEASDEANLTDDQPISSPKDSKPDAKNFSIPPQYKQASKPDDNAVQSSIYEHDSYNAFADNNTPSNTKPWMWVIIFLGIVALGVALSFGTFFAVGN